MKLCFVFLMIFVLYVSSDAPDEFEKFRDAYEDEPEEVTLHVDELQDWIGEDPEQARRDELHAVGMCWQSEMARCVNDCSNSTMNVEILQEICASYCQADVTWMCTKLNIDYGGTEIFKFAGRWPFRRVLCFTEFGSVLFCVFSVLMHMFWLFEYITATDKITHKNSGTEAAYPYRFLWISTQVIWMITFTCATAFHTVDIRITEYLDYFTATLSTLFGLWACLIRIFEVKRSSVMWLLAMPLVGFYGFHLMRMIGIRFAYGYNMRMTIALVILQTGLWGIWGLYNIRRLPHVKWMLVGHICLLMFAPLEVIDRPPLLGLFDTHAFWHLSLNLIFGIWNRFYIRDTIHYRSTQPKAD